MKSDEPPGIKSFGINVDFGDIENQRELSERSRNHGLAMNNIHIPGGDIDLDEDMSLHSDFSAMEWYMSHLDFLIGTSLSFDLLGLEISCACFGVFAFGQSCWSCCYCCRLRTLLSQTIGRPFPKMSHSTPSCWRSSISDLSSSSIVYVQTNLKTCWMNCRTSCPSKTGESINLSLQDA